MSTCFSNSRSRPRSDVPLLLPSLREGEADDRDDEDEGGANRDGRFAARTALRSAMLLENAAVLMLCVLNARSPPRFGGARGPPGTEGNALGTIAGRGFDIDIELFIGGALVRRVPPAELLIEKEAIVGGLFGLLMLPLRPSEEKKLVFEELEELELEDAALASIRKGMGMVDVEGRAVVPIERGESAG